MALTVLIPCFNNEDIIEDCLKSVTWADEILVCDSFSTDRTLEIARAFGARILQHEYVCSAAQKNWAIPQAACEWVLIVDTDERVSAALRTEIAAVLSDPADTVGFYIPRENYSFGRRLRHGGYWPDYQLRLFRKEKARYKAREVHAAMSANGRTACLKNPFIHYHDRSLEQVVKKYFIRYARWEAEERLKRERASYLKLILMPPAVFGYRYIVQRGFLDGVGGFIAATLWSIYFFCTYLYMLLWKGSK